MDNNKKKSTWMLGESVGTWLTRRLQEEFNKLPDRQKISAETGNSINPKKWLSEKAMIDLSTLYSLEKSEARHISRENLREKLAKLLGYYGYPMYIPKVDSSEFGASIWENISKDFHSLFNSLPRSNSTCPFCLSDTNYFLERAYRKKSIRTNTVKTLYVGSHNFKQFGAAQKYKDQDCFELEISICEKCLVSHEQVFTSPVSIIIKDLQSKFPHLNLSYKMIARIVGVDESTISRIANGKISKLEPDLLKKIIGLWSIGHLKPYVLTENYLYKEYIEGAVKVVLGEIELEDFIPHKEDLLDWIRGSDVMPESEEDFCLENFSYSPLELSYNTEGVYLKVKAKYEFEKRIRDMIFAQSAEQELLVTLVTPKNALYEVEIIKNYICESARVC